MRFSLSQPYLPRKEKDSVMTTFTHLSHSMYNNTGCVLQILMHGFQKFSIDIQDSNRRFWYPPCNILIFELFTILTLTRIVFFTHCAVCKCKTHRMKFSSQQAASRFLLQTASSMKCDRGTVSNMAGFCCECSCW